MDLSEFGPIHATDRCKIARTLDELEPDDQAKFEAALKADSGITTEAIVRVFLKRGKKVGSRTVLLHRRGECCCE